MAIPPRISIITVSYNSVATIEETILSVVEQDYPTIEYIIIDGGSTDGTLDIIKKYESHLSYWQSSPDQNMYDAINKGLGKVSGQLWMSLNSDDYLASSQVVSIVATYYKRYGSTYGAYYGNIIKKKEIYFVLFGFLQPIIRFYWLLSIVVLCLNLLLFC